MGICTASVCAHGSGREPQSQQAVGPQVLVAPQIQEPRLEGLAGTVR